MKQFLILITLFFSLSGLWAEADKAAKAQLWYRVIFITGDQMTCKLDMLREGNLVCTPKFSPGTQLSIPVEEISVIKALDPPVKSTGDKKSPEDSSSKKPSPSDAAEEEEQEADEDEEEIVEDEPDRPRTPFGPSVRVSRAKKPGAASNQEKEQKPHKRDMLKLHNGSVFYGELQKLDKTHIHFNVDGLSEIKCPLNYVSAYVKAGTVIKLPKTMVINGQDFILLTDKGNLLRGNVQPRNAKEIDIQSDSVKATVKTDTLAMLLFPDPVIDYNKTTTAAQKKLFAVIKSNENLIAGLHPQIKADKFYFTLPWEEQLILPMSEIKVFNFYFQEQLNGKQGVFLWGAYSDQDDEYGKTLKIIREGLGKNWQLEESFSKEISNKFIEDFMRYRCLVIPEMEKWTLEDWSSYAEKLRPAFARYLNKGGRIVILAPRTKQLAFLRDAGLIDLTYMRNGNAIDIVNRAPEHKIMKRISQTFKSSNGTNFYKFKDKEIKSLADAEHGSAVLVKPVSRGSVVVIGADYYQSNKDVRQLLLNAIRN